MTWARKVELAAEHGFTFQTFYWGNAAGASVLSYDSSAGGGYFIVHADRSSDARHFKRFDTALRAAAAGPVPLTTTRRKVGPAAYEVYAADGTLLGSYGGREGARWATDAEGNLITENSRISAGLARRLVEGASLDR